VIARAVAGVVLGAGLVVLGLAFFFGETATADEVDCGAPAPDLATGRAVADGTAAFRTECEGAAREEVAAGLGAVILGATVAGRSLVAPRLHRSLATEAARMARRRAWGPWRATLATARLGLWATAVAAPVALAAAPIAPVAMVGAASLATWLGVAAFAAGPRLSARPDGLAVRSRRFLTTVVRWDRIELVLAEPEGIELWTDDLPLPTGVLGAGWSGRRRQVAEAAARSIATEVVRATGRSEEAVATLVGLAPPPDAIAPDHPEWDEAWEKVRAQDRRELVREVAAMAALTAAVVGLERWFG
jgi:hypothetical protein